jgi:membrane protease YdiL (CAAX protease family)
VSGKVSTTFAAVFYGLAVLAAWFFGVFLADLDLLEWHNRHATSVEFDAMLGVGVGLVVVVLSAVLERSAEWARRLSEAFADILGPLSMGQVFILALTSGIGEELFFRGFLQQWLSVSVFGGAYGEWLGLAVASIIFGGVHVGPEPRTFLPWTLMAVVMGFALGGMYMYTGNVLAPILAHFTINFLNLSLIAQQAAERED